MSIRQVLALMAILIGCIGTYQFAEYDWRAGFFDADNRLDGVWPWLNNIGLILLFALQHSGMARQTFKKVIVRWIPATLERSLYVAMSGIVVGMLAFFWHPLPGEPFSEGPDWINAISLLGALGVIVCCWWTDLPGFLGLRQATTGNAELHEPFRMDGPYRFVRHPLMLCLLVFLWARPIMPPELLMMNVGLTIYILIAIRLEERDLVREFGADYENYRKKVPALIPYRLFV